MAGAGSPQLCFAGRSSSTTRGRRDTEDRRKRQAARVRVVEDVGPEDLMTP